MASAPTAEEAEPGALLARPGHHVVRQQEQAGHLEQHRHRHRHEPQPARRGDVQRQPEQHHGNHHGVVVAISAELEDDQRVPGVQYDRFEDVARPQPVDDVREAGRRRAGGPTLTSALYASTLSTSLAVATAPRERQASGRSRPARRSTARCARADGSSGRSGPRGTRTATLVYGFTCSAPAMWLYMTYEKMIRREQAGHHEQRRVKRQRRSHDGRGTEHLRQTAAHHQHCHEVEQRTPR